MTSDERLSEGVGASLSERLSDRLRELVRACFTAIWVTSQEQPDALREIDQLCRDEGWRLAQWDVESGLTLVGSGPAEQATDPLAAIRALPSLSTEASLQTGSHAVPETTILVLRNYHRFLGSAEIVQALDHQIQRGKQHRTMIIILAPLTDIPVELEKAFVVVDHALPDRSALKEIAEGVATEEGELPAGLELERVLQAAGGLTRSEAENAFSLSLVRTQRIEAECIWELKTGQLQKSGLLQLYRGSARFAELGGLESLKHFCRRSLVDSSTDETQRKRSTAALARPRGVLLLSPPGCGKSQFCKALGWETGRPVLMLDVGALLGSLVGQSEQRTRQALAIADAMAPCVLMIDEVEKAFAGFGGGAGDSGVASRVFGTVLTWLNEHTSDVYVVCTSNDVSRLPGEFARAERFDGVFFVDLPSRAEKDLIWDLYQSTFGHDSDQDAEQSRPADEQWTGAEIKSCCRLAALLNVPLVQAAENVVPVAVTASESVERLRTWAVGRCLDAHRGGLYQSPPTGGGDRGAGSQVKDSAAGRRRRVKRGPSMN